ncbi:MAG TPA: tetratricopeptide repeat protein [Verrucomicrobiota bacterium]|nr:tetratricopeptide repeat protein [Verrucomicrobiota bacterium]HNU52249.1 tetratricopeptide repeat protein [Verrucomicrobiota bacterium]
MKGLEPPDSHHVKAAQGWLTLGDAAEALGELSKVSAECAEHSEVLRVRWDVLHQLKRGEEALHVAQRLAVSAPEEAETWVRLANSYYYLKRMEDAYGCAKESLVRFPLSSALHYDLACYACYLGRLDEAQELLRRSFQLDGAGRLQAWARRDPDLEPLRQRGGWE